MNLYSTKQRWKITLLILALLLVGVSLFISNHIVKRVGDQEREHVQQWAGTIKKRVELIQFTNQLFSQIREKEREKMRMWVEASKEIADPTIESIPEFPLQIVRENNDIPVILISKGEIYGSRNIDFDTADLRPTYSNLSSKELLKKYDDSLLVLAQNWKAKNQSFTIEVYKGMFMTYAYSDSKAIVQLEKERDSLFQSFNQELIDNKGLVPVLLINQSTRKLIGTNISDSLFVQKGVEDWVQEMSKSKDSLVIDFQQNEQSVLYYDSSQELKQLKYFPYIQYLIIGLFIFISYLLFSTFRKAEQNQVWAGMAKETAHQLGTPISSLLAWVQLLETQDVDTMIAKEMQKDVDRLLVVTDRFSKIGSEANFESTDFTATIYETVEYLQPRISKQVKFTAAIKENIQAAHNASLLSWVVENIVKNAIDAMEGKGELSIELTTNSGWAQIDIIDTGKGLTQKQIRTIFKPGYTTKKRGWGLGLSLAKRIVEDYHKGKVMVVDSQVGVGTTFRISIPL